MLVWFSLESSFFFSQRVNEQVWNWLTIFPPLHCSSTHWPLLSVFTLVSAFFHFFICMPLHSLSESPSHATVLLRGSSSFPLWNSFHTQWLPQNVNEAAASGSFPLPVSHNTYYDTAIMSHAHAHNWYTRIWTRNGDIAVYYSMNGQSFAQSSK